MPSTCTPTTCLHALLPCTQYCMLWACECNHLYVHVGMHACVCMIAICMQKSVYACGYVHALLVCVFVLL